MIDSAEEWNQADPTSNKKVTLVCALGIVAVGSVFLVFLCLVFGRTEYGGSGSVQERQKPADIARPDLGSREREAVRSFFLKYADDPPSVEFIEWQPARWVSKGSYGNSVLIEVLIRGKNRLGAKQTREYLFVLRKCKVYHYCLKDHGHVNCISTWVTLDNGDLASLPRYDPKRHPESSQIQPEKKTGEQIDHFLGPKLPSNSKK